MIHAYPERRHEQPWCYGGPMKTRTGKGSANKLFRRITCPECRAKVGAFLAWLQKGDA